MSSEMMVGDREAAGAIAGMIETYGRNLPGEGEWVSGVCCGKKFSGSVLSVQDGLVMVDIDGGWIAVRPSDIHEPLPGIPMDVLVTDPSELETEALELVEAQRLRKWYEQEVGYDPVSDDPSMTLDELRELCIGFAEEAGIASPVSAEG